MILLDTHIWIWWLQQDHRMPRESLRILDTKPSNELSISVISCWEVATLYSLQKLTFPISLNEWMNIAVKRSTITLAPLDPEISVESVLLPGDFHRDPADRIIVATARIYNCPLITADQKILSYPHVSAIHPINLPKVYSSND